MSINPGSLDWGAILINECADLQPVEEPAAFHGRGGWSGASFWTWKSLAGQVLMKIWPIDGPQETHHHCRHKRLDGLRQVNHRLALPIADRYGRTLRRWQGERWAELMPWLDGTPVWVDPSDAQISYVVQALTDFHHQWQSFGPVYHRTSDAVTCRLFQLRKIARINDAEQICSMDKFRNTCNCTTFGMLHEVVKLSCSLVKKSIDTLSTFEHYTYRIQTVLRDARPDQFLFVHDVPTGVIDFGAVGSDSVAVDLARITSEWFPNDPDRAARFIRKYEGNRRLSILEHDSIRPLAMAGAVLGGLAWMDLHFVKKRTVGRDREFQVALDHALQRLTAFTDVFRDGL